MKTSLYKKIAEKEIFPALWCTEPIAIAYAVSRAKEYTSSKITSIVVTLDAGTHKNAIGVIIPNSWNNKGTNTAAALWLFWNPTKWLEVLEWLSEKEIWRALAIVGQNIISTTVNDAADLYIKVEIQTEDLEKITAIIEKTHTNVVSILVDNEEKIKNNTLHGGDDIIWNYQEWVKNLSLEDMIALSKEIDDADIDQIKRGIEMQLSIWEELKNLFPDEFEKLRASYSWIMYSTHLSEILLRCTSATYARMSGVNKPVMSSWWSGNQWIIAMLLPYLYGTKVLGLKTDDRILYESIALSNIINSYVKSHTGAVSSMCGCYIAAGTWAIAAMLYQSGKNEGDIHLGIGNMIASSGGVICDGAKIGCYNKVAASVVNSINAVSQSNNSFWVSHTDGIIGKDSLESIRNISRIANEGWINKVLIPILLSK